MQGKKGDRSLKTIVVIGSFAPEDGDVVAAISGECGRNVVILNTCIAPMQAWAIHCSQSGKIIGVKPYLIAGKPDPNARGNPHVEVSPMSGAGYVVISMTDPGTHAAPVLVDERSLPSLLAQGFVGRLGQTVALINRSAATIAAAIEGAVRELVEIRPWSVRVLKPGKGSRVRLLGQVPVAVRGGRWGAKDVVRAEQMLGLRPRRNRREHRASAW